MNPLSIGSLSSVSAAYVKANNERAVDRKGVLDSLTHNLHREIIYLDTCQRELKEAQAKKERINAWVPSDSAEVIVRRRMLQQAREDIILIKEDVDGGRRRLRAAKVALKEVDKEVARINATRRAELAYIKLRQKEDAVLAPRVDAVRMKLKWLGLYENHWEDSNE